VRPKYQGLSILHNCTDGFDHQKEEDVRRVASAGPNLGWEWYKFKLFEGLSPGWEWSKYQDLFKPIWVQKSERER